MRLDIITQPCSSEPNANALWDYDADTGQFLHFGLWAKNHHAHPLHIGRHEALSRGAWQRRVPEPMRAQGTVAGMALD